ncbi:DoxX family protein [Mucilaginibacter pallidiroseus]|uniref:DoxX family protein n=1 Tax=Mucilaginibacter pallidiroseus TaxID=2599295 RepID=A0A563TZD5_9SPHI|nr:DoxX family protein [Mucilaginibacter pallidiroseus]TWR24727.1 DoxX family protein [Mucilaginibacter pallidiroseus]
MSTSITPWTNTEKNVFRFLLIFFVLLVVPLDWKYYAHILSIKWTDLQFSDIFYISRYTPQPTGSYHPEIWGLATLTDVVIIAVLALVIAVATPFIVKRELNYPLAKYWLKTLLRYRLAIALLAYGFIKFFPLQSPYPSISSLNTAYGEFNRWKLFSLGLGITPGYESFLGFVELLAAGLLLFRRTALFGAIIVLLFTGNVFFSNLAYEGGEGIYSIYLLVIALYIVAYDALRLYNLIALRNPTLPDTVKPVLKNSQWITLAAAKAGLILFFVFIYGFKTYAAYTKGGYHYPKGKGIAGTAGLYNVTVFKLNGKNHPYSDTDSVRWQNVVFEKWNTISIKTLQPKLIDSSLTEEVHPNEFERNYELAGSGERNYYHYTVGKQGNLLLANKNSHYKDDKLTLQFSRPDSTHIILQGLSATKDSVYAELTLIPKKYLLKEAVGGRNRSLKL